MNRKFAHILDEALAEESAGRSLDQILETNSGQAQQLRPLLESARALDRIRGMELPGKPVLKADRRVFLREIAQLEINPVSPSLLVRIKRWIAAVIPTYTIKQLIEPKERRKMSAILANIVLILCVVLASAGGTVALAADSLPDSPLYQVKLAVEQIQIGLLAEPEKIAAQHLVLAQNRSQEILRLARGGETPQEGTALKLQEHYNRALQYAAQLGEAEMLGILTQAQRMAQEQLQEMVQAKSLLRWEHQDPLGETIRILQQTQTRVQAGLDDPEAFRWQARFGFEEAGGNPDCPLDGCQPLGDEHHYGPQPDQPGPGEKDGNPDCPSDYLGEGDQHHYGPQPEAPGPGEPDGNPDRDCDDCQPSGDEQNYGPQPDQPGSGEQGGNPECPQADCEPSGDQNQNGQPDTSGSSQPGTGDGGDQSAGVQGRGAP